MGWMGQLYSLPCIDLFLERNLMLSNWHYNTLLSNTQSSTPSTQAAKRCFENHHLLFSLPSSYPVSGV